MTNRMKMGLILLAFVVLAFSSMACNVTPGDGKVADAVVDTNSAIKDAATEIKAAVESTGSGIEVETHGTVVIDSLWDIAKDIAEGE